MMMMRGRGGDGRGNAGAVVSAAGSNVAFDRSSFRLGRGMLGRWVGLLCLLLTNIPTRLIGVRSPFRRDGWVFSCLENQNRGSVSSCLENQA